MKKKDKIINKTYFDVKVDVLLPAVLHYRVMAETAEEAASMIKNLQPNGIKHRLVGRKEFKITVYDAGSNMIKFIKNLMGILR